MKTKRAKKLFIPKGPDELMKPRPDETPTGIFNTEPRYLTVRELRERLGDSMIHENDFTNIVDVKRGVNYAAVYLIGPLGT